MVKKVAYLTDIGRVRKENQDAYYADVDKGLFIVCDGMGGERGGAIAAKAVVSLLPKMIDERLSALPEGTETDICDALKEAIATLSAMLRERTKDEPELRGMGATVVLALVKGNNAYIAHIGDSRAYLFWSGSLKRLTRDHSIVAVMLELGQITEEQARSHPARGKLSRYIGMQGKAVADVQKVALEPGARLLLCSDGLTNMVSDGEIADILEKESDCKAACQRLVEEANRAGGYDNITAIIIDF